jgi:hypothetical protein
MSFHVPEQYRVTWGACRSDASYGNNGAFLIPATAYTREMSIIASDGTDMPALGLPPWEHVSVKAWDGRKTRIPTWKEMCWVKDLCWDAEDTVMQLHPPQSQWINTHRDVLHLWRPVGEAIPLPPAITVGDAALGTLGGTGR